MQVKDLRIQRGWSQEQLSEFSGLNVRTIQRIEKSQRASTESLKALAAVFEVELVQLTAEVKGNTADTHTEFEEHDLEQAIEHVEKVKIFYMHIAVFIVVNIFLAILNYVLTPHVWWFYYATFGWTVGLIIHALTVYDIFSLTGTDWEKKQLQKRLNKKR